MLFFSEVGNGARLLAAVAAVSLAAGCGGGKGFMEDNARNGHGGDTGDAGSGDAGADAGGEDPPGPGRIVGLWAEPAPGTRAMRFTDGGDVTLADSPDDLDAGTASTMRWLMSDDNLTLVSLTGICTETGETRVATYTFEVNAKYLILTPVSEPCADRAVIGKKTWNRVEQ